MKWSSYLWARYTDPVLVKYKDKIKDFAYITTYLHSMQNIWAELTWADKARLREGAKRNEVYD